jgi:hypothetical protein
VCQAVEIRRVDELIAIARQRISAELVCHEEQDVRPRRRAALWCKNGRRSQRQESATMHIVSMAAANLQTGEPWTASLLLDTLERALHASKSEWMFLRELRVGTGHRGEVLQRLDAFALNCLPYQGMKRVCYEIKISRADFKSEIKSPLKKKVGMRYSNEFYFVTPGGLLAAEEIPIECGLIEIGQATGEEWKTLMKRQAGFFYYDAERAHYCMMTVPACWRETPGPTWQFVAAMLRNQRRELEERPPAPPKQQKIQFEG